VEITRQQFIQAGAVAGGVAAAGVTWLGVSAAASARQWFSPHASWLDLTNTSLGCNATVVNNALNQGTTWFMTGYRGRDAPSPLGTKESVSTSRRTGMVMTASSMRLAGACLRGRRPRSTTAGTGRGHPSKSRGAAHGLDPQVLTIARPHRVPSAIRFATAVGL
jgi:hypothetical protein